MSKFVWARWTVDDDSFIGALIDALVPRDTDVPAGCEALSNNLRTMCDDAKALSDDDDAWMNVAPDDVDSALKSRFDELADVDLDISDEDGDDDHEDDADDDHADTTAKPPPTTSKKSAGDNEIFDARAFGTLIDLMHRFVAQESTLDGVETGVKKDGDDDDDDVDGDVKFDENEFLSVMRRALDGVHDNNHVSDDDDDDDEYDEAMRRELAKTEMVRVISVCEANETSSLCRQNHLYVSVMSMQLLMQMQMLLLLLLLLLLLRRARFQSTTTTTTTTTNQLMSMSILCLILWIRMSHNAARLGQLPRCSTHSLSNKTRAQTQMH
jgi:hypothetical protein